MDVFTLCLFLFSTLLTFVSSHTHIHCHHAESCANERLYWTNETDPYVSIHCHGMAACFNSTIRSPVGYWSPNCDASVACVDLKQAQNETLVQFTCGGYYGCYNAFSYVYASTISCGGMKSCTGSNTLMYSNYIQCNGLASCMDASISIGSDSIGTENAYLYGYGTLSLYNTNIISKGEGLTTHIYLYGFLSGYQTSIECNGNDTCIIYCKTPFSCIDIICNENDGATCATLYYDFGNDETNSTIDVSMYVDDIMDEFEDLTNELGNDDITNIGESYNNYYNELCPNNNNCKNKYDCDNSTIIVENSENTTNTKYVCLTGYGAANDNAASITTGDMVDIVVDGGYSMRGGTFESGNIHCRSSDSCQGDLSTMNGLGNVYCNGQNTCKDSDTSWSNINNIYCMSRDSCAKMDEGLIGINNIYGFGEGSLDSSVINSTGDISNPQNMTIYLGGHGSGSGMIVNCFGNDICKIKCMGTSLSCLDNIEYELNCIDDTATCEEASLESLLIVDSYQSTIIIDENENNAFNNKASASIGFILFGLIYIIFT